jgi:hypothetical protein
VINSAGSKAVKAGRASVQTISDIADSQVMSRLTAINNPVAPRKKTDSEYGTKRKKILGREMNIIAERKEVPNSLNNSNAEKINRIPLNPEMPTGPSPLYFQIMGNSGKKAELSLA